MLSVSVPNYVTGEARWQVSTEERRRIKQQVIKRYNKGAAVWEIAEGIGIPNKTVAGWIRRLINSGEIAKRRPPRTG